MNRNNIRQTLLAPVVLLLAAALGMAGCTQGEDTLPGADGNDGARILNINVGPKQGFLSGDADSRSTVDESTGAMAWEEGDRIFLTVTYTGVSAEGQYTMVRNTTAWDFYKGYVGTHDENGNAIDLSGHTSFNGIPVPTGATAITRIIAYHTDNDTYLSNGMSMVLMEGGSCDQLRQVLDNPDMNAGITLELRHASVARLYFPGGLTPGKKYYPGGSFSIGIMQLGQTTGTSKSDLFSFTAAPDGSLAICIAENGSKTVTLKEKDADADDTNDKVVYASTFNVTFGSSYRCIIPAAGGTNPDSKPDLLKPAPIVANNKVYAVNGYWVTAPNADESKEYQWAASLDATKMDSDPCAGRGGWRMPTMKDFEKMAGWIASHPWSQDSEKENSIDIDSDKDAWNAAFPYGTYWSSVARASDSNAWSMYSFGNGAAYYNWLNKTTSYNVRCVQPQ
ncbi:DUF1566 domain-containing protein [Bacteroides fragilis]|uniref:Lcl C-terminal domain-containing protein n=1 Tax=Bacteroides fragilis TaxID=817 RepID=UPI00202E7D31|nr:DUF1566 domain-containing protein [Bacteroides fragilis]MCM0238789.1 DUF1566 domain-containing protein [Bacteroides fragilis]